MVGVTIGTMADHPENQTGVGGTIGTLAYHPANQMGVGGTIGTMAYHPANQTGAGGTIHFEHGLCVHLYMHYFKLQMTVSP